VTEPDREIHLPSGYRLDRSDPDVWALRRPEGWVVAHFSAQGVSRRPYRRWLGRITKTMERRSTREEDIRLSALLQGLLVLRGQVPHLHLYQERHTRETGELESRLAALEELLSEVIPAMEIRGHESAPIQEMDWRLGF